MIEIKLVSLIGLTAAICTTAAFLPQAIRIISTKRTRDISLTMYIIFSLGTFLWLIYGLLIKDFPVIIANAVTFTLSFIILSMKLRYK